MSTKIYSSLPLLYISIFFACVTITVSYDVNWTVTVDTSADVDEHNWTLPITWTNPHGDTHYYIYFDITDRYDFTTRLWEDARSECQSEEFSSTEGGCYLLEVNERMETLRFLEYMNTGHYSSELWVNHYNVGPDLYSGRTDQPTEYPVPLDVLIPYSWLNPNGTLYFGSFQFHNFKSEADTTVRKNFFCECDDVCQTMLDPCSDSCCESGHETCSVMADEPTTAFCSCPVCEYRILS